MIITFRLCSEINEESNTGTVIDEPWAIFTKAVNMPSLIDGLLGEPVMFSGKTNEIRVAQEIIIGRDCHIEGLKVSYDGVHEYTRFTRLSDKDIPKGSSFFAQWSMDFSGLKGIGSRPAVMRMMQQLLQVLDDQRTSHNPA